MHDVKKYIEAFLSQHKISITSNKLNLFESFVIDEDNINAVNTIQQNQKKMLDKWKIKNRIDDINNQVIVLPNGTVGKAYSAKIDFLGLGWKDVIFSKISENEPTGLSYNNTDEIISGIPKQSGELIFDLLYRIEGEEENSELNSKKIKIIINPDPKSLWKDLKSDETDPFWKVDNVCCSGNFADKKIIVASKRGRSHANVASFRDDDFAFKSFDKTGWNIIAVSDGAGSAANSRKGSQLACELVISYFEEHFTLDSLNEFDTILNDYHNKIGDDTSKKISHFVYNNLSKAAWHVHKKIEEFSLKSEKTFKEFHSTLIFALVKKYEFGYAILTFGVGDCPIGLINKDETEIKLMNWLDVGEFGGGTRFITMPEIFQSDKFSTRFGFKLITDFSYLMLMTDGIYDPKFVVEANLEKIESWKNFIEDLKGKNEDNVGIDFEGDANESANNLSTWMDFWSPGNHDDRTLAIIF